MGMQLREGPINWVQDLAASASTTVYPGSVGTAATAGIPRPVNARGASRVHVAMDYTVASGTLSTQVSLYGYTESNSSGTAGTFAAVSTWVFLGALNGGASITANAATWTFSATRILVSEVFSVSAENYTRYATRAYATGGTTPSVSTYIGFVLD